MCVSRSGRTHCDTYIPSWFGELDSYSNTIILSEQLTISCHTQVKKNCSWKMCCMRNKRYRNKKQSSFKKGKIIKLNIKFKWKSHSFFVKRSDFSISSVWVWRSMRIRFCYGYYPGLASEWSNWRGRDLNWQKSQHLVPRVELAELSPTIILFLLNNLSTLQVFLCHFHSDLQPLAELIIWSGWRGIFVHKDQAHSTLSFIYLFFTK